VPDSGHPEEAAFIEIPFWSPASCGEASSGALRNKFLMAKPSRVTDVLEPSGPIPGTELEAVPLPGHFVGMIGARTPGGTLFCADALASRRSWSNIRSFSIRRGRPPQDTRLPGGLRRGALCTLPCAPTRDVRPWWKPTAEP
jgi:hypothetical protein